MDAVSNIIGATRFELAEQVKQARAKKKLSQFKLAKLVGLSRATIISIEKGRVTRITYDKMAAILRTLNFSWHV